MPNLHVFTMFSGDGLRLQNYRRFVSHLRDSGMNDLYTVEVATDSFKIAPVADSHYMQLRTDTPEIWHKERAINLAMRELLPVDAEFVAWLDADIYFCNPDWSRRAVALLQKRKVVQLFSHTQDLGPSWQPVGVVEEGFVHRYVNGRPVVVGKEISGVGWAVRREVLDKIKLVDWIISGHADTDMAWGFFSLNNADEKKSRVYRGKLDAWVSEVRALVRNEDVSYVQGLVLHSWHGPRDDRGYVQVDQLLSKYAFDPDKDISLNPWGLYEFTGNNPKLQKAMKQWHEQRERA